MQCYTVYKNHHPKNKNNKKQNNKKQKKDLQVLYVFSRSSIAALSGPKETLKLM